MKRICSLVTVPKEKFSVYHSLGFLCVDSPAILSKGVLPENHSLAPLHLPSVPRNKGELAGSSSLGSVGFRSAVFCLFFFPEGFRWFWKFSLQTQDSLLNNRPLSYHWMGWKMYEFWKGVCLQRWKLIATQYFSSYLCLQDWVHREGAAILGPSLVC